MRRYVFRLTFLALAALGTSVVLGNDQQIAKTIVEKLSAEKSAGNLKGFSIDLKVETDGTVWLTGRVSTEEQRSLALNIAARVKGVKQVNSKDGTVVVLAEDSNQVLPRLFESAGTHGTRIISVSIQEPNLEAVFLHLTGKALRE